MQCRTLTVKYLLLLVCSLSLNSFAQSVENEVHLNQSTGTPADTLKKNNEQVDQIISFAKTFLGTPYRYAGTTPSGFDCSGFISYVFGNFGFSLIHSSYGMAELGATVKLAEVQPGDLLFFKGSNINSTQVGHVAMVTEVRPDAILFIHYATGGVMINKFKTSKYYNSRFIKAKRLDYGQGQ